MLVVFKRRDHIKRRDAYFELVFVVEVFHNVAAVHTANLGVQVATTDILVFFSGADHGLHPNNALTFYLPVAAVAIEDEPMAALKFYRKGIMIFDGNAVGKHKLRLKRVGIVLLVKGLNAHFDTFRDHADHMDKFILQEI